MRRTRFTISGAMLIAIVVLGAITLMEASPKIESISPIVKPPYTDYCAMLSQEIQGKKHGFMAGNLVYYIGGRYASWNKQEDETIGLTHPFFHDLRSRGYGMVEHLGSGYGHDFQGWEFYKYTRIAYGTVIIGETQYPYPVPTKMYWRPDKMICEYSVGGVNIQEEKFIADNDVACSIITSDSPVTIKFDGYSFVQPAKSYERTSTIEYDGPNNAIHIVEGGTIEVKPVQNEYYEGTLMYDGMSTVISASKNFSSSYSVYRDSEGRQVYSFAVSCDSSGVAIVWAMDDEYSNALSCAQAVFADPAGKLADKTEYMNNLLNCQIPYFRCSDDEIVNVYYYLWSIYLMYYIDVGKGWEDYPHTQTAVNNFLGMHRYDANFQIKVGSWTADKQYYAYGNVLHWRHLLPYAKSNGRLPDNKGIAWLSPVWGATTEHVIGAWQIYEHMGDVAFLHECYDDYFKPLFWNGMLGHWGCNYDAAKCLHDMAVLTGDSDDPNHWYDVVNMDGLDNWLNNMWEKNGVPYYFGAGAGKLDWSGFAYLRNSYFPKDWASQMTARWAVDAKDGFFGQVPLTTTALKDWDQASDNFASTPDINYYSIIGMFYHHVGNDANICALGHLKNYNMKWGIPVAPESWDKNFEIWGDQYSNFNAGKILLILEGIAGLSYSIPDDISTICDNMPEEWSFMEVMVPITKNGTTDWTQIRIDRNESGTNVNKTITVNGNSQEHLLIQPWLEDRNLISANPINYTLNLPSGHASFSFQNVQNANVVISLEMNHNPTGIFLSSLSIPENEPIGTVVGILSAKDADLDDTHIFNFASCDSNDSISFMIENDSLKTKEVFDYETKNRYYLCIQTTDNHGGFYEESFAIRVEDLSELPDTIIGDTLVETFTGPDFDLGTAPNGLWELVANGGSFNGQGQYTIETDSGGVGLSCEIGSGDFVATLDVSNISWISDFSKVFWVIRDDDSNAFVYFVEKGDTWMKIIVDMRAEGTSFRPVNQTISIPNAVKLKIQWTDSTKVWRLWYGLNGAEPTIEPAGSPVTSYAVTSSIDRQISLLAGQWRTGEISIDLNYFELIIGKTSSAIEDGESTLPKEYVLYQNFPNPFNSSTNISFTLPQDQKISLTIYNMLGREVINLFNQFLSAGEHTISWDGLDKMGNRVSSGIYFYRINANRFIDTKKMLLIR